jgi:hypothetical protein
MKIPMKERRVLVKNHAREYQCESRKGKGRILDHFVKLTGYNRVYAARVLRNHGKCRHMGKGIVVQGEAAGCFKRGRGREYGLELVGPLAVIWENLDYLCGKRLVQGLPGALESLERHGELELDPESRRKLLKMSASTMDRLLAEKRAEYVLKGRSGTKPGTLLKSQIPVRTFADWDERKPGFVEIDLVAHDGGSSRGDYTQTLDVTDIHTGWSEQAAVLNKAPIWVFEALLKVRSRLPFPLLGIDSDNGGEFINHPLYEYCIKEEITFTRSRPERKNDNCFVEQKNYSIVRRAVGHGRYVGQKAVSKLNQLYALIRLRTNFFLPSMKLEEKQRQGSRVRKKYDDPKTPFQRLMDSPDIPETSKQKLQEQFVTLNLVELNRKIRKIQTALDRMAVRPGGLQEAGPKTSLGIHQQKKGRPSPPEPPAAFPSERRMAPAEKG